LALGLKCVLVCKNYGLKFRFKNIPQNANWLFLPYYTIFWPNYRAIAFYVTPAVGPGLKVRFSMQKLRLKI
jgi:hypothetical protein